MLKVMDLHISKPYQCRWCYLSSIDILHNKCQRIFSLKWKIIRVHKYVVKLYSTGQKTGHDIHNCSIEKDPQPIIIYSAKLSLIFEQRLVFHITKYLRHSRKMIKEN